MKSSFCRKNVETKLCCVSFSENVSFGARVVLGVFGTMPVDLLTMLRWRLPPMLITLVLVLKLGTDDIRPSSLDFCELFAGGAEASGALRRVPLKHIFFNLCCFLFCHL